MSKIVLTFIALINTGSVACADWQFVKWGMTPAAAIAASKGQARALKPGEDVVCAFTSQTPVATIPQKSIGEYDFQVTLCIDNSGKVSSVALSPVDGTNLPTLRNSLVSQYGQPTRSGSTQIWNDQKTGNTVSYYDVGGVVGRIEYKKLGGSGL